MRYILPTLSILVFANTVLAGSANVTIPMETAADNTTAHSKPTLKVGTDYVFESDFKNGSFGSQDAFRYDASLLFPFMLSENIRLTIGAEGAKTDFGSSSAPVPNSLQRVSGVIGLEYLVNNQPAVFFQTRPGFQSAGDLESDAFDSPTVLTLAFQPADKLILMVGALYSQFSRYPVLPIAGFVWTPSDTVKVNGLLPEPGVLIKLNESTTLFLGGELVGGFFRVSDGEPYAGDDMTYFEIRGSTGLNYSFSEHCGMELRAGWAFTRQFYFDDADKRIKVEGAPFVKVSFSASF